MRRRAGINQTRLAYDLRVAPSTINEIAAGVTSARKDHVDLLGRLADRLDLTDEERLSLFRLSLDRDPPNGGEFAQDFEDCAVHCELVRDHSWPGLVCDTRWNVMYFNHAFTELFPTVGIGDNMIRWTLTHPSAKTILVDYEHSWARPMLRRLKTQAAETKDSRLLALYQEMSPLFNADDPVGLHSSFGEVRRMLLFDGRIAKVESLTYQPYTAFPSSYAVIWLRVVGIPAWELRLDAVAPPEGSPTGP